MMANLFAIVSFLFLVMETLIGMVANGSIVFINNIDWLRSGKLSPTDLILICLALSRFSLQAVVILNVTLFTLFENTANNIVFLLMGIWVLTNTVNLWFAACLSVFYLAKIAIFSHPFFLQVKQTFSRLVPWMLLGSVVLSAVLTIIIMTSWNYAFFTCNPYASLLSNKSNAEMGMPPVCRYVTALYALFDFIPFVVFLSSSTLLISSLWKHMRHVPHNGTKDLSTQAHLRAIKSLASFAVLYLVNFAAFILQIILLWSNQQSWAAVIYNVSAVYHSGHAIILIFINPKLKQAWVMLVHRLKMPLSKVPS